MTTNSIKTHEYYCGESSKEDLVDIESVQWFLAEGLGKFINEHMVEQLPLSFIQRTLYMQILNKWIDQDLLNKKILYPIVNDWIQQKIDERRMNDDELIELFDQILNEIIEKTISIIDSHSYILK
jgi:hypothetical protein